MAEAHRRPVWLRPEVAGATHKAVASVDQVAQEEVEGAEGSVEEAVEAADRDLVVDLRGDVAARAVDPADPVGPAEIASPT